MALAQHTFRIFVSSTFNDLKAERNALQARVFPRLRELAGRHDRRLQVIDLRWGVSEEASLDQQAMDICLNEVARCQQSTPRPNFVVLLGDRYGWCPPPSHIPAPLFDQITTVSSGSDKEVLQDWYFLDRNALKPHWILKPRLRGTVYETEEGWQPVEARLQSIISDAVIALQLDPLQALPYISSATEQEIAAGALNVDDAAEHVFCFLRSIEGFPEKFKIEDFQTVLERRFRKEYNDQSIPASISNLINSILAMGAATTIKEVDEQIREVSDTIPDHSREEDMLNFIKSTLVDFTAANFRNLNPQDWSVNEKAFKRQQELKQSLAKKLPNTIHQYECQWLDHSVTTDHLDQLCQDVYRSLSSLIQEEITHPHVGFKKSKKKVLFAPDPALDEEGSAHQRFAEEKIQFFVGRTESLRRINEYLVSESKNIFCIVGAGGSGKTALLAKALHQTINSHKEAQIIYRFIGATSRSSDVRSLLRSISSEVLKRYGISSTDIPDGFQELVTFFHEKLQTANPENPLFLFIDSLDQLSDNHNARDLSWLPAILPDHVHLIVSTREEEPFFALKNKKCDFEKLKGLSKEEGVDLLDQWLTAVGRTLQTKQTDEVITKFIASEGNPLYLRLAFEEAKLWTSDSDQPVEELGIGIKGIIEKNMINRLQKEDNHGEMMVTRALGYLAAARFGLSEDELVDLLSRDFQVYQWFFLKSRHIPPDLLHWAVKYLRGEAAPPQNDIALAEEERKAAHWLKEIRNPPEKVGEFLQSILSQKDGPRLPIVLWSRLSFDLEPYLTERMVDGNTLLTFYHRELGDVAANIFCQGEQARQLHSNLADYFESTGDPQGDRSWIGGDKHALSELPYHLTSADRMEDAYNLLTDFNYLERKVSEVNIQEQTDEDGNTTRTYLGILQLQDDFDRILIHSDNSTSREDSSGNSSPLILTAVKKDDVIRIHCPACNRSSHIEASSLGQTIICPQANCSQSLKLNPFFTDLDK